MRPRGIHRQLLIASVVPAVVVTLVVSSWLVTMRVSDLRDHQRRLGQVVASQLAPAAEYGVFSGNTVVLQRLADAALAEADLRSVTIRDRNRMVLAAATKAPALDADSSALSAWLGGLFVDPDATAAFRAPVVQPTTDLGEFDPPLDDYRSSEIGSIEIEIALLPAIARQIDAVVTGSALALAGLLASLLLARRLGERIGEPIGRLAAAMRRVRGGDLTVRVAETSTNELGLLESGMNRMADEVQRTQRTLEDQVERATADLQQTVAALEVSNVELDLARKRALEASHLKSEFLASMSHEIRTPMSGIIGFTNLLARSPLDAAQQEHVRTIQKSADTLMRILNDVLDLSRIEAGKLVLADDPFDVRESVDDVLALLAPLAYAKGLTVRRNVARDVPRLARGDGARVQQILTNLVGNAIKYTHAGGVTVEVTLDAHPQPGRMRVAIAVADTGIGIPADVQRQLFQAFAQATPSTALYPGAGLGLVISNKLVEAMGGEVELDSEAGRGSRFVVTLELRPAGTEDTGTRWQGRRMLVCDADPLTRDHLAQLLELEGADVESVAELPAHLDHDMVVVGRAGADTDASRALAERISGRPVVLLLDTHDEVEFATCLPRCATTRGFRRAVAAALGEPVPSRGATPPAAALARMSLLVVDDNRINRVLLAQQLEARGATVDACDSGETALERCAAQRFDAVLLDLQMPGIGGLETARRLRTSAAGSLIVAVTANVLATRTHGTRAAGISAVIVKPVDEQALVDLLAAHLARCDAATAELRALAPDVRMLLHEELPAQVAAFQRAVAADDDGGAVAAAAHDLAGTAGACRLRGLADAVEALRAKHDAVAIERVFSETIALECALTRVPHG